MFICFPYKTPELSYFLSIVNHKPVLSVVEGAQTIVNSHLSIVNGKGLVGHFVRLVRILTFFQPWRLRGRVEKIVELSLFVTGGRCPTQFFPE